jgi:hypothetical protein
MKFESLILAALFAVCFGICASVMGAMLKAAPAAVQLANSAGKAAAVVLVTPVNCARTDDATCSRG